MHITFLVAALGVAGVAGAIALRPSPVRVEVVRVRRGPMRVTVDAEGKTRARDRFVVAAPVSGRLARIDLHRGDAVRRDEVIARIEPLPMAPLDLRQFAEAKARVATAEQLKHEADFEFEVLSGLREGETVIAHPSNLIADGVSVFANKK
jgi:multidrug efflux pump subunit AcrA (membrane-fusion protein)